MPVPTTHAEWKLPNLCVCYPSIDYSIEYGSLLIETLVMQAVRHTYERQQEAQRQAL